MHCCLFDKECWRDWWEYGMPLRLHWGQPGPDTRHFVTLLPPLWWRNPLNRNDWEPVEFAPHLWVTMGGDETDPVRTFRCPGREAVGRIRSVTCRECGELNPE